MVLGEGYQTKRVSSSSSPRTAEETLFLRYRRSHTPVLRDDIVYRYFPLVKHVVDQMKRGLPRTVDLGDLQGAGSLGLLNAIESYEPSRGVPFQSYAEIRIRGSILDELRHEDWLPRHQRTLVERIKEIREELVGVLKREPYEQEMLAKAEEKGVTYEQIYPIVTNGHKVLLPSAYKNNVGLLKPSSFSAINDDGYIEQLIIDSSSLPEYQISVLEVIKRVYQSLTSQEQQVIHLRYW
ncbi:MAG: sigma-70 family RNA polymerase sigma factor, partial [Nanoarchaeota archaeon]